MKAILTKPVLRLIPAVLAAIVLLGEARPAQAASVSCFSDLSNCYAWAATIDNFWVRWAAGLDCELSFASCLRSVFIGE